MADVKWIKLTTGFFDSNTIKLLRDEPDGSAIILVWINLLVQAGKINAGGWVQRNEELGYNRRQLARLLDESQDIVGRALDYFIKDSMIEVMDDDRILILNWEKYQNEDGLSRIRKNQAEASKRYRDKKKREKEEAKQAKAAAAAAAEQKAAELEITDGYFEAAPADENPPVGNVIDLKIGDRHMTRHMPDTSSSHDSHHIERERDKDKEFNSLSYREMEKAKFAEIASRFMEKSDPEEELIMPEPYKYEGELNILQAMKHYGLEINGGIGTSESIRSFQGYMEDDVILEAIKLSFGKDDQYANGILKRWNARKIKTMKDLAPKGGAASSGSVNKRNYGSSAGNAKAAGGLDTARKQSRPGKQVYTARD